MYIFNYKEPEEWIVINDFKKVIDDRYAVSNYGEVKDLETGQIIHKKIAGKKAGHPYYAASLIHKDNRKQWVLIHQLVAEFFCKKPIKLVLEGKELVPDHLDNNGLNNFYKNLEWKTRGQNTSDAFKMGYINFNGEKARDAIIKDEEAHQICKMLEDNAPYDDIIERMNFPDDKQHRTLLVRIKNGHAWRFISEKYNIDSKTVQLNKKQRFMVSQLPMIRQLMKEGLSNVEIIEKLWKDDETMSRNARMVTLQNIRKNKIYKEY